MKKKAVAFNTLVQLIGKIISIIINLVIVYLLTHHYSLTEFGEYTAVFAYLLLFNILADLGLSTILVRDIHEYSDEEQSRFIGNVILIRACSLIISLILGVIIAQFIPQYASAIKIGILIASASSFFLLMASLLFSLFQNKLQMQKSVYANASGLIANLLFLIIFIHFHLSIDYAISATTIGYFVIFLVSILFVLPLKRISFSPDRAIWKKVFAQSISVGGMILFSSIYFKSDSVILSLMKPAAVLSIYAVPYKILEVFIAFPQMFMAPVFAFMASEIKKEQMGNFTRMFQKSLDFLILAGLPIIPGALFLSQKIIPLYVGARYANSVDILKILSFAIFLSFIGSSFIFVVLLFKKQTYLLVWNIFLSIFNISLNLIFIPRYSYYASAWITVATEALVLAGSVYVVFYILKQIPNFAIIKKGILATVAFTFALAFLSPFNLFIQVIIAGIVYLLAIILLKAVTLDEIKEILR